MAKRRKFIYTIQSHGKKYIVTRQQFIDRLASQEADQVVYAGWCGVDIANYGKAQKLTRKMQQRNCGGYVYTGISFRIFDEEEWKRYPKEWKEEYATFNGNVHSL